MSEEIKFPCTKCGENKTVDCFPINIKHRLIGWVCINCREKLPSSHKTYKVKFISGYQEYTHMKRAAASKGLAVGEYLMQLYRQKTLDKNK